MAYILDGTTIRSPQKLNESNSTQVAQQRTLDGSISRDYFGSNKRIWKLNYKNTVKADYDTIRSRYDSYLANSTPMTWESTETNYTVAQTTVHVDLKIRKFAVGGSNYISDFVLTLTEA